MEVLDHLRLSGEYKNAERDNKASLLLLRKPLHPRDAQPIHSASQQQCKTLLQACPCNSGCKPTPHQHAANGTQCKQKLNQTPPVSMMPENRRIRRLCSSSRSPLRLDHQRLAAVTRQDEMRLVGASFMNIVFNQGNTRRLRFSCRRRKDRHPRHFPNVWAGFPGRLLGREGALAAEVLRQT